MEDRGNNISDATPVVRIKAAIKKLSDELHEMEVRGEMWGRKCGGRDEEGVWGVCAAPVVRIKAAIKKLSDELLEMEVRRSVELGFAGKFHTAGREKYGEGRRGQVCTWLFIR